MMIDFCDLPTRACASARRISGSAIPPIARPPSLMKLRRETPSQNCRALPVMFNIMTFFLCLPPLLTSPPAQREFVNSKNQTNSRIGWNPSTTDCGRPLKSGTRAAFTSMPSV